MEETYLTKSLILNRRAFNEDDIKVIIYTPEKGKLELVVRGAKKIKSKLAGHLEPICLSNIMVVRGKLYDYIGSAVGIRCFSNIKNNLEKIKLAGQAINIFNKLVKGGEGDKSIFKLLENFLSIFDKKELLATNYQIFYNFFILKLLVQLGYKPELYNCLVCKKKIVPNNNLFDLAKGGLVCGSCEMQSSNSRQLTISNNCIKVLRIVIKNDFTELAKLKTNNQLASEAINIISSFLNYHFELKI